MCIMCAYIYRENKFGNSDKKASLFNNIWCCRCVIYIYICHIECYSRPKDKLSMRQITIWQ